MSSIGSKRVRRQARLEPLECGHARRVEGSDGAIARLTEGYGRALVHDPKGLPLILFDSEWTLRTTMERESELGFHEVQP